MRREGRLDFSLPLLLLPGNAYKALVLHWLLVLIELALPIVQRVHLPILLGHLTLVHLTAVLAQEATIEIGGRFLDGACSREGDYLTAARREGVNGFVHLSSITLALHKLFIREVKNHCRLAG